MFDQLGAAEASARIASRTSEGTGSGLNARTEWREAASVENISAWFVMPPCSHGGGGEAAQARTLTATLVPKDTGPE